MYTYKYTCMLQCRHCRHEFSPPPEVPKYWERSCPCWPSSMSGCLVDTLGKWLCHLRGNQQQRWLWNEWTTTTWDGVFCLNYHNCGFHGLKIYGRISKRPHMKIHIFIGHFTSDSKFQRKFHIFQWKFHLDQQIVWIFTHFTSDGTPTSKVHQVAKARRVVLLWASGWTIEKRIFEYIYIHIYICIYVYRSIYIYMYIIEYKD